MPPRVCSHCEATTEAVAACEACGCPRPLSELERETYFTLFGLPATFQINRTVLEKSYLELSRKLHPDRQREPAFVAPARRAAALVNEAYAVLKDKLKRARYWIELHSPQPGAKLSSEFLSEQWDWRERAAEASPEARAALRAEVTSRMRDEEAALDQALADATRLDDAKRLLDELQFFNTLLRDLDGVSR